MSDYLASIPLAEVKQFLNLTDTDVNREDWLQREVKTQLETIEAYLDRPVVVQQFRDELDGTGYDSMDLDSTPVQSVVDLRIDYNRRFGVDTRIDPSKYSVDADCVEMLYDAFPRGRRNVRINYIAGYAEIEIPFARRRFDIRESAGGDLLTAYLPTGKWRPTELAESLESALNDIGEHERSVAFDWTHRHFTIVTQVDYLEILTHVNNQFTSTTSATGLLGFHKTGTLTDGAIVGDAVTLGIPEAIKTTALELVAIHYSQSAFGRNHYGLESYTLDDYRVVYETGSEDGSQDGAGIPERLKNRLKPFKKWDLF